MRLLGPVDVTVNQAVRSVSGMRRKAALAALALQHRDIVSTDRLVDIVWGDTPPPTADNTLQSHLSHLRHVLRNKNAIRARPPGYVLDLGPDGTDVEVAERLIRTSAGTDDESERIRLLQSALALWRGRPLMDIDGSGWLDEHAHRLERLWLETTQQLVSARLAQGEHAQVLPELESLAHQHPFEEQLHRLLMLALYRTGRQADALAAMQRLRRTLGDELGIDPSNEVRALEAAILRQDPVLDLVPADRPIPRLARATPAHSAVPAGQPAALADGPVRLDPVPGTSTPAQLPPAVHGFAGRSRELAHLDAMLATTTVTRSEAPTVVISAVSGTAGVGKTALALHWAHRVAGEFPDGQLYVNLRGFDPGGAALEPCEALRGFLEAFDVPMARIPSSLDGRTALYRSLVSGKRILVVLDNARDVEQVRPLLPGSAGCLVVVTSRHRLTSLVAAEGAYPLILDTLTRTEARDLLSHRLGADRVAREPGAVDQIITSCARLPLALAIAAARAATQPDFPLSTVAGELCSAQGTLDAFDGGDSATDVRAVFSCSYRTLSPAAARLFRLLGLHPAPEISVAAAASLGALGPDTIRALLAELIQAHLLTQTAPGRYCFHDLLRAYAAEQVQRFETAADRRSAVRRLLDHFLHTALGAATLLEPYLDPIPTAPPGVGVVVSQLRTADAALAWFATEHAALTAAVPWAAELGCDAHAWQLSWTTTTFRLRRGLWAAHTAAHLVAVEAARRLGDPVGEAHALAGLALGYARSGQTLEAYPCFERALELFGQVGDHASQADIHISLEWLAERAGQAADTLSHAMAALDLFRAAGHRAGQVRVLNDIGLGYALLGDYVQATAYCNRALVANRELGQRCWEAATWDSLGYIHLQLGDVDQAITSYQNSVDICRDLGDRFCEAATLTNLGGAHQRAGHGEAARKAWLQALNIYEEMGHPDADGVRLKLALAEEPAPV